MHFLIKLNKSAKPMKNLFINKIGSTSGYFLFVYLIFLISSCVKAQSGQSGCITHVGYNSSRIDYETILPCGANKITLTFSKFKVPSTAFLLKIYDGTDASGKALHPGSGFTYGNVPTSPLVAYSGAMYLYFSCTGSGTDTMYAACWTSEGDTAKPVAKFEIADTIYNSVKNTFKNTSQNISSKTDYIWKIEPGYGDVSYSKDLNYTLYTNSKYDVTLRTTTCSGTSKYTKSVVVITPDYKVALDFKAKNTKPIIDKADTLSAIYFSNFKRPTKADRFHWFFYPDSVTYLNGTSADSPTIQVKFKAIGKYKVTLEAWNNSSPTLSYNEVIKKDYITVQEPPSPKVYIDIKAKKINPLVGETDTLLAIDSISGKLYKADRFNWMFNPSTVTYLNGTSKEMKTIQVKFNDTGRYTVSLQGWNSIDSAKTYNDTSKPNFILVQKPAIRKAYFDFSAKNLNPLVGETDTLYVIDSIKGKGVKANRFKWQISPNRFNYINGTNDESKIIQIKFKSEGKYTITLFGWNSEDSAKTYNDTIKTNYLTVKGTVNYKVYLDFKADNLKPKVGDDVIILAIDSTEGKPYKANRFRWEFLPDNVTYINGSTSDNQTIKVKFNEKGKYSVHLTGWNWADSAATFNGTIKADYISVEDALSSVGKTQVISSLITIYPNPGQGKFNLYFNQGCIETMSIQIYNSTGKLINETSGTKCTGHIQSVDLSNEPCGLYIVKILSDKGQIVQKVSVIR